MLTLPFDVTAASCRPAKGIKITRPDGTVLRIADSQASFTIPADGTYAPLAGCLLKAIKHTSGGAVPTSQIEFAHSDGGTFDSNEVADGLYDGATVQVYVVDRANIAAGGAELFSGSIQGLELGVDGSGAFTLMGHSVQSENLVRTYLPTCDTDLFSTLCTLDPDDFEMAATVVALIDRYNVELSIGSPPADFHFNDGVGQTSSGQNFRIANWFQTGQQLTTFLPNTLLFTEGMTLRLWPGCDKLHATCRDKFENTLNFQGFPHFLGALAATVQV